jgi:hypothetical protein
LGGLVRTGKISQTLPAALTAVNKFAVGQILQITLVIREMPTLIIHGIVPMQAEGLEAT